MPVHGTIAPLTHDPQDSPLKIVLTAIGGYSTTIMAFARVRSSAAPNF